MRLALLSLVLTAALSACTDDPAPSPAPPAPPATSAPAPAANVTAAAQAMEARAEAGVELSRIYKHPLGVYFHYPTTWTVKETGGPLSLVPDDLVRGAGGPEEVFLVLGDRAAEHTDPAAPEVVALVERMIATDLPFLTRDGDPERVTLQRYRGVRLAWKGTNPAGTPVAARMWVTILEGYAVAMFAATKPDRIEARARVMAEIFATLGFKQPKGDPRLVGTWRYTYTYMSGSFSAVSEEVMVLTADGVCLSGSKLMASMSHTDSAGDYTGDSSVGSGRGVRHRGRWSTAGKQITLTWAGSTEQWRFIVSGPDMLWKQGRKTKKLWKRIR